LGVALLRIDAGVNGKHRHAVGQSGVGTRIARVGLDSLFKVTKRLLHAFESSLVPAVTALQVELIGLWAFGVASRQPRLLLRCEPHPQPPRDLGGDFFLSGKDIHELAFVLLTPKLQTIVDVHQLSGDYKNIASLEN